MSNAITVTLVLNKVIRQKDRMDQVSISLPQINCPFVDTEVFSTECVNFMTYAPKGSGVSWASEVFGIPESDIEVVDA